MPSEYNLPPAPNRTNLTSNCASYSFIESVTHLTWWQRWSCCCGLLFVLRLRCSHSPPFVVYSVVVPFWPQTRPSLAANTVSVVIWRRPAERDRLRWSWSDVHYITGLHSCMIVWARHSFQDTLKISARNDTIHKCNIHLKNIWFYCLLQISGFRWLMCALMRHVLSQNVMRVWWQVDFEVTKAWTCLLYSGSFIVNLRCLS